MSKYDRIKSSGMLLIALLLVSLPGLSSTASADEDATENSIKNTIKTIKQGKQIFRHDTFGNEAFFIL